MMYGSDALLHCSVLFAFSFLEKVTNENSFRHAKQRELLQQYARSRLGNGAYNAGLQNKEAYA